MRIRDTFLGEIPNFENRLLYAMYTNKYDDNAESAWGYIDASKELLETYKPTEELEAYINKFVEINKSLDEYDRAYVQAYRDYIKQEQKARATNE